MRIRVTQRRYHPAECSIANRAIGSCRYQSAILSSAMCLVGRLVAFAIPIEIVPVFDLGLVAVDLVLGFDFYLRSVFGLS